jgi:hypothetical protein
MNDGSFAGSLVFGIFCCNETSTRNQFWHPPTHIIIIILGISGDRLSEAFMGARFDE